MDEATTRREIIDKKLCLAGWDLSDRSQVIPELDIELEKAGFPPVKEPRKHPYEGHQFADYALQLRNKPAAVVEAKRTSKDQTGWLEKRNLVESPFTQIHPKGIRGVFGKAEIEEILEFAGALVPAN